MCQERLSRFKAPPGLAHHFKFNPGPSPEIPMFLWSPQSLTSTKLSSVVGTVPEALRAEGEEKRETISEIRRAASAFRERVEVGVRALKGEGSKGRGL